MGRRRFDDEDEMEPNSRQEGRKRNKPRRGRNDEYQQDEFQSYRMNPFNRDD